MNLVFASDDRGVDMMATAIYSVIKNNQRHKLNFYIIHSGITAQNIQRVSKLEQKFSNTTIKLILADSKKFKDVEVNNKNVTMEAYYRYLAPDILPQEDRSLCIDFDMLCISDLGELYNTKLGNNYIGAVAEYFVTDDNPNDNYLYRQIREAIGLKKDEVYINSGLLLMNLKLLRESGIMNEFWENIRNKSSLLPGRTNNFADQTITNLTFKGKIKYLSPKYNVYTTALEGLHIKEPAIVHFTGHKKPLTYIDGPSSAYDDVYANYYSECVHIIGYGKNNIIKNTVQKIRADIDYHKKEVSRTQAELVAAQDALSDKEQEVAMLHRQQRDIRFLAKRLMTEVQTRVNRRAQGLLVNDHLYYKKSTDITTLNNSKITKNDIERIHKLDIENIDHKKTSTLDKLKPVAWKLFAEALNLSLRIGKRVYRYAK